MNKIIFNDITNINNIPKANRSNTKAFSNKKDCISFTGLRVSTTTDPKEIKELVNIFYDGITSNLRTKPKFHCKFLEKPYNLVNKFGRYIATLPFMIVAKDKYAITEAIKLGNKISGGYSININPLKSNAHIGFITLSKEFMKTRDGINTLKLIGERIIKNLEVNNVKTITWTTNEKNKQINRLLHRFNAEKIKTIASETEYKISLQKFKEVIEKLNH